METEKSQATIIKNSSRVVTMPHVVGRDWVIANALQFPDKQAHLTLDFSSTQRIDSSGTCFLQLLHNDFKAARGKLILRNISSELLASVQYGSNPQQAEQKQETEKNVAVKMGQSAIVLKDEMEKALSVLTEMIYWGTFGLFEKRDFRRGVLGEQMYLLGFKAIGIVVLLALLIGLILSLQTAMQLETFGAGVFLAPMIGKLMVLELGPLLTAIILAGRNGSATTAEIATMGVGEELDALRTMGINPIQFVVVPKFWAISITMPALSLIATAAGIVGGFIVAVLYLDLSPGMFWSDFGTYITLKDITMGFTKSVVFSWLIIWIGAVYGLRVHGGAEAVGKETTASVVSGIFAVIIADSIFSLI